MALIEADRPSSEKSTTMAEDVRMALADLLGKAEAEPGLDVLRQGVRVLAQAVMEVEGEHHLDTAS